MRHEAGDAVFGGFVVDFDDACAAGFFEKFFKFGLRVGFAVEDDIVIGEELAEGFELRACRGEHFDIALEVEFFHPIGGIGEEAKFLRGLLEDAEVL